MVRMMGTGPVFDGMGLINTIYSYGPEIAISFTSDRAIMPDPAVYAEALKRSFEALRDANWDMKPKAQSKPEPKRTEPVSTAKAKAKSTKKPPAKKAAAKSVTPKKTG